MSRARPASAGPLALVLDVDGTLVDSNYLHVVAWARALVDAGHPVPMAAIHHQIGKGADDAVRALLDDPDDALVEEVVAGHADRFRDLHDDLRALPGARALLHAAAERGLRPVLASSAEPDDHAANLRALDADDVIHGSTQSDDVDSAKPDPDLFLAALAVADVSADRALAVGDTVWDLESAAGAGYPCVAVTTGGIGASELEEAGALLVLSGPEELVERLDEVLDLAFPTADREARSRRGRGAP
jgi:HAD superfamily hydrolase (TIGR01509 family)